jgi:hypothetical protein
MGMAMAMSMRVTMSRAVPVIVWMVMIVMRRHGAVKAFLPLAGNIHT